MTAIPDPAIPPIQNDDRRPSGPANGSRAVARFLWWIALFILVALPLGWGFEQLLSRFEEGWTESRRDELQTRADHLLATFERRLSPIPLVQRALQRFQNRFHPDRFDPATLARLELRFRRRFPATATRFWFDPEGRLVLPQGTAPLTGIKVWQALFRYLDRDQVTPSERLLAENLMKNSLGTMIDRTMLCQGFRETCEVVFNGQPNFFRILSFSDRAGKRVGSLVLFIPRSHLPRGWELASAMRSMGTPEQLIGGFWQSRGAGLGTGPLGSNLLHGLFSSLTGGRPSVDYAGTLFRSRLLPDDPDFMMTVGLRDSDWQDKSIPQTLLLLRYLTACSVLVIGILCILIGVGRLHFDPPLQRKFLFGTALLALPPLVAMILLGFIQSGIIHRNTRLDQQRSLEAELYRVEQAYADHLNRLRETIRKLLASPPLIEGADEGAIRSSLGTLRQLGMIRYTYTHVSGKRLMYGFQPRDAKHRSIEDTVMNRLLAGSGLQINSPTPSASDSMGLDFLFGDSDSQRGLWSGMNDSLSVFQFGPMSWYVFNGFAANAAGSQTAYLFLSFDIARVGRIFLKRTAKRSPEQSAFEFFTSQTPPDSYALRALLLSAATRQSPIFSTIAGADGESMALARPLRGLNLCGGVRLKLAGEAPAVASQKLSLLITLTAIAAALLAAGLLRRRLLEPVQHLAACVDRLDQGDLRTTALQSDPDELGVLATSFNRLADGLRQKSAMTAFVRPDLAFEASRRPAGQVARRRVTILFAGLRRFSALEQTLAPRVALALMSRFLGLCDTSCRTHGGMIDKFIGDSAMGVFLENPGDALAAAIELRRAATELMAERARRDLPTLRFGIGLATGEAVTGDIGSRRKRLDFTVIGDTVNLAARLEKLAGHPDGPTILAVGEICTIQPTGFHWTPAAIDTVRGRKGSLDIQSLSDAGSDPGNPTMRGEPHG